MARPERRTVRHVAAAFAVVIAVAGCSAAPTPPAEAPAADAASQVEARTLVDVRTPQETAEGHLEGALLIDLQGPDFAEQIAELPRDEPYLVYCRSGNRAGQAIEIMTELGFTDVVNGGAYDDLAEAGVPTA